MRFWFSGPSLFGIRPGISFGPEDFRAHRASGSYGARGYVYVIQRDGDHRVKVGSSIDPDRRVRDLQTGSADRLYVAWSMPFSGDYEAVEKEAHAILDKHRGFNEWFAVPVDVAVAAISAAAFRSGQQAYHSPARPTLRGTFLVAVCLWTVFWLGVAQSSLFLAIAAMVIAGIIVAGRGSRLSGSSLTLSDISRWCGAVACAGFLAIPASLLLQAGISRAAPAVPNYDVKAYCGNLAKFMGNAATEAGCVSNESVSRSKLETRWADVPASVQAQCVAQVAAGSAGNYQALAGCLTLNMGAMWLNGDVKIAR